MRTNTDITIYNRVIVNREDVFIRSHLYRVHCEDTEGQSRANPNTMKVDKATIYIPFSVKADEGKQYRKPKAFKREPASHYTLQIDDLIVKGIVTDEITSANELERKYDDVRSISYVDSADYGDINLQHFEVGAV